MMTNERAKMISNIDAVLLYKAMSDETRLKILEMLIKEELCACHILEVFNITQPTLSYHMKILVECDLVESRKDGNWMRYKLNQVRVKELNQFMNQFVYQDEVLVRDVSCD